MVAVGVLLFFVGSALELVLSFNACRQFLCLIIVPSSNGGGGCSCRFYKNHALQIRREDAQFAEVLAICFGSFSHLYNFPMFLHWV